MLAIRAVFDLLPHSSDWKLFFTFFLYIFSHPHISFFNFISHLYIQLVVLFYFFPSSVIFNFFPPPYPTGSFFYIFPHPHIQMAVITLFPLRRWRERVRRTERL